MENRRQLATVTRQRIINAAHDLLGRPDGGSLALNEVASEAGVSRATIYNSIGCRGDLLRAVFVDQGRLIDFDRVLQAMEKSSPLVAVVDTVKESCRAWGVIPDAIRRTLALSIVDPEIAQLVEKYELARRKRLEKLARRVKKAGVTLSNLGTRDITQSLVLCTSFTSFDQLLLDSDQERATAQLVNIAKRSIGI